MTWASAAYKGGPHFINQVGVSASCGDCHIPYDSRHATPIENLQLLTFKGQLGVKDFYLGGRLAKEPLLPQKSVIPTLTPPCGAHG